MSHSVQALALSREKVSLGNSLLPEAVAIERDFAELTTLEQEVSWLHGDSRVFGRVDILTLSIV